MNPVVLMLVSLIAPFCMATGKHNYINVLVFCEDFLWLLKTFVFCLLEPVVLACCMLCRCAVFT